MRARSKRTCNKHQQNNIAQPFFAPISSESTHLKHATLNTWRNKEAKKKVFMGTTRHRRRRHWNLCRGTIQIRCRLQRPYKSKRACFMLFCCACKHTHTHSGCYFECSKRNRAKEDLESILSKDHHRKRQKIQRAKINKFKMKDLNR